MLVLETSGLNSATTTRHGRHRHFSSANGVPMFAAQQRSTELLVPFVQAAPACIASVQRTSCCSGGNLNSASSAVEGTRNGGRFVMNKPACPGRQHCKAPRDTRACIASAERAEASRASASNFDLGQGMGTADMGTATILPYPPRETSTLDSSTANDSSILHESQPAQPSQVPEQPGILTQGGVPAVNQVSANGKGLEATASPVESTSFSYPPAERNQIRESWGTLMRWSKFLKTRKDEVSPIEATRKIVVFGGGSFGTAVGSVLAKQKADMDVVMLLRDPHLCKDINHLHCNTRYLKEFRLPPNMRATTSPSEAILGAQYAVHAVPVQSSRAFLVGVRDLLPREVPIICLSKGLEVGTGLMMSELIPSALERKQPAVFLSGPSFAREVMENRPTGVVAACRDTKLSRNVQALFANQSMRVNTTSDVVGVEICGALKNVLAIAAGIVEGLELGNNAMAALIAQGCSEIRWLSEKMGAKPTTMSGLSGLGDIMLTCYGNLSRNRSVGIRLGRGERLEDILASSPQVAEGVATAGVVVSLARRYRVSLPVLTAVAQVLDNALTPSEAVSHIMNLPQIEER